MRKLKQFLGLFLAVCLIVGAFPITARAASDDGLGGAVTANDGNIGLTVTGLGGADSWTIEQELKHDDCTVLSASGTYNPLTVTPNKPCYIVFDYRYIGNVDTSFMGPYFSFLANTVNTYYSVVDTAFIASADSDVNGTWHTGVIDCAEDGCVTAIFNLTDYLSSGAKAYISNIRVYEQLPEEYKAHVTVNYTDSHGELTGSISKNGQKEKQLDLGEVTSGESFEIPMYSVLWEGNFESASGASFDGFKITTPSGQTEQVQKYHVTDSSNKELFYFTEHGNYTIDVLSSKAADEAELKVSHSADGSEWTDAGSPHTSNNGDLYVEKYGSNQTWKLQFTKGDKRYDSITIKDNGAETVLSPEKEEYTLTPGNEIHRIDIVYRQQDCTDTEKHLVIWPTLDFDMAFGKKEGVTDDFWETTKLNEIDAKDEKTGTYNFLYDPTTNSGAGIDEKHPYVFSSRLKPNDSTDFTSNTFTFSTDGLFAFDYMVYNGNTEGKNYDDSGYTFTVSKNQSNFVTKGSGMSGWTHVDTEVGSGDKVTILFYDSSHVGTWLGISNINFLSEKVKLTVTKEGQGRVTGNGGEGSVEHYKGQTLTLEATPNVGSAFVGWYDSDGTLITTDSVLPYTTNSDATLKAKFAEILDNVAQIGENFYKSLDEAFTAAKTMDGNTVVRLLGTEQRIDSNFTIPKGETLLLPSSIGDTGYSPVTGYNPDGTSTSTRTGAVGTQYFNLTIPTGVTLTVEGTVLVNAVTGRPGQGHYDMDVTGGYAQITLDGNIVVKSGGVLDVCGYVKGSEAGTGTITAEPGGEVRDLYIVRNWRGGSQAFHIFPQIYPMNEVDMHNIEVKTVINAGAKFVGTVKMYASGSYYYTRFPQVDQGNGLIQQESGTVTRTYDTQSKRETWVLDGTGKISSSILKIVGMDLSTGTFLYPIDGDMDFVVKGDWTVVERLKFMPGAKVNLEEGTLTLDEKTVRAPRDNEIVFYGDFNDPVNTSSTQYPDNRGHAQLTIYGGTTTNVNCAFGGEIVVDPAATPANPAVIKFMAGKAVEVTSQEANGYLKGQRTLTFTATLGGYKVKSGETYSCYYEGDTLIIELAGESKTQEAVYSGAAVAWTGGESVQYLVDGAWTADAPTNAGEYPVGVNVEGGADGYKLVKRVGVLTIKPIAAEFAIEPKNVFEYDGEPKTVTVKVKNAKAEGEVTALTGADSRLTGTDKGTYTVTVTGLEGTGKDNYTIEGGTATLTWSIAAKPEATPDGLGTEFAGNITGLHEGENYKIDGTEVTAGADGKTPIQDAWFGRTVDVVKSGDGVNTSDSAAAHLEIPARPEAPAASPSQASGASATDGSITVTVKDGESYEYRKSAAETWTEVPEDGKIGGLSYGDYYVRVKGTETSFPGAAQKVTVSYYMPVLPSTSSQTITNPDGSTTTTTTKPDGTKTETTTKTDGTVTEKTTKTDGSVSEKTTQTDGTVTEKNTEKSGVVTETTTKPDNTVTEKVTQTDGSATEKTTTPDGVVGQKSTDSEGKVTSAEVVIPKEAEKQDVVTAPVEVPAAKTAEEAPEISVRTESTESKKVEIPVTEFGPGTVAVIVHEDGTEEVVRDCTIGENGVVLNVEGDVTLKIVDKAETFEDVEDANHWASNAVEFVAARELFNGTAENTFTPNGSMTRGMMVTVLYRLAYEPDAVEEGFADVKSDAYYSDAVAWAAENGVVNGYADNKFAPDDNVSREQLVTILHRYAQKKGYATETSGTLANFADAQSVSSWAADAMSWAIQLGLVNGTDASHISPAKSATRAEVATILMRFCEKVVK